MNQRAGYDDYGEFIPLGERNYKNLMYILKLS